MTPIKITLVLGLAIGLSGCGGGFRADGGSSARLYATGPIQTACLRAGREAASRRLCGCVQAVADDTLTSGEQSRAVGFFRDPHQAQVVRQSDRSSDERFWQRYRRFVETSESRCG